MSPNPGPSAIAGGCTAILLSVLLTLGGKPARAASTTYLTYRLDATQFLAPPPRQQSVEQRTELAAVRVTPGRGAPSR